MFGGTRLPAAFRLPGLITRLTVCSLGVRAGFVSHRQRSWDSPFGAFPSRTVPEAFPLERTHMPIVRPVHIAAHGSEAGPDDCGFWALPRTRVPCDRRVISATPAGCSLGLSPFQGVQAANFAERPRLPLTRFLRSDRVETQCATEFRDSLLGPNQRRAQGTVGFRQPS